MKEESEKASLKLNMQKINMASSPITSGKQMKKSKNGDILFSSAPESLQMVTAATKLKDVCFLEGKLWQS